MWIRLLIVIFSTDNRNFLVSASSDGFIKGFCSILHATNHVRSNGLLHSVWELDLEVNGDEPQQLLQPLTEVNVDARITSLISTLIMDLPAEAPTKPRCESDPLSLWWPLLKLSLSPLSSAPAKEAKRISKEKKPKLQVTVEEEEQNEQATENKKRKRSGSQNAKPQQSQHKSPRKVCNSGHHHWSGSSLNWMAKCRLCLPSRDLLRELMRIKRRKSNPAPKARRNQYVVDSKSQKCEGIYSSNTLLLFCSVLFSGVTFSFIPNNTAASTS